MSIASGFFDTLVENNEYDRAYGSQDFVDYFANVVGSGVAISENPNSMLVYIDGTDAIVSAGYLFIDGYWLKNSTGYTISLSSIAPGNYVIVARLSRSNRSIILRYEPESDSYVDCLVLAKITKPSVGSITSQDTRSDTSICGTIDTISSLNDAINLALDNVATFSEQIEVFQTTLNNQALLISQKFSEVDAIETAKIAEANALLASTESPVVGSVQYSAQSPGNKWLKCDGSYVDGTVYPDLVTLLHTSDYPMPTPSSTEIASGNGKISNLVILDGYAYFYKVSSHELKRISLTDGTITNIDISGSSLVSRLNTTNDVYLTLLSTGVLRIIQAGDNVFFTSSSAISSDTTALSFNMTNTGEYTAESGVYLGLPRLNNDYPYRAVLKITRDSTLGYKAIGRVIDDLTRSSNLYLCKGGEDGSVPFGIIPVVGFNKKFDDKAAIVTFEIVTISGVKHHKSTLHSSTDIDYIVPAESDTDFESNTVSLLNSVPVKCNDKFIYGSTISNRKLILYVSSLSQFRLYKKEFNFILPNNSQVFVDAACYLEDKGLFVMFVGTGFFFAYDLLDPGTYGYYDTTGLIGELLYNVTCEYISSSKKLFLTGKNPNSNTKLYTFNVESWDYSNTGAYLPTIHNESVDGYIRALR